MVGEIEIYKVEMIGDKSGICIGAYISSGQVFMCYCAHCCILVETICRSVIVIDICPVHICNIEVNPGDIIKHSPNGEVVAASCFNTHSAFHIIGALVDIQCAMEQPPGIIIAIPEYLHR